MNKRSRNSSSRSILSVFHILAICFLLPGNSWGQENAGSRPERFTEVEGVSEYRLPNGCRVLVYPDASAQVLTVNMTVLVGSRHEGYGETGMAHLLEHMLFKGTPKHPNVDQELKQRGATDMNGTTWYDRTNFYQTLPASNENLEWAISMEADRLVNCFIRAEDLFSEMTVVRSEFEMNENMPQQILMQRMNANAFEWHNYGKTVIGSKADIERVPVNNLRRFYQKYYRPDNVVLIVTGKVDEKSVIEIATKYFGALSKPAAELDLTYTQEPNQDGERVVYLRRTGGTPTVGVVYHIPSASHSDYPAIKLLSQMLGMEPNGILFQEMVKTQRASQVSAMSMECYDPGMLTAMATPADAMADEQAVSSLASQLATLMESGLDKYLTPELLEQAKAALAKSFEQGVLDSKSLAMTLSDWSAYGDWRLFFLTRDRTENVSLDDLNRVAGEYLRASNRTTGIYLPTEQPHRSNIPATPTIENVVKDYKSSKAAVSVDQAFEPTPLEIQKRLVEGTLESGVKYAFLPKSNRGNQFHIQLTLDFGTPQDFNTRESLSAASLLGPCMMLGTEKFSREQLDRLQTKYKTQIRIMSQPGELTLSLEGREEFQSETLELVRELLRKPKFPEDEFSQFKSSQLTEMSQAKNDPGMIAQLAMGRALNPVEKSDIQYVPTFQEMFSELRKSRLDDVKNVYGLLAGNHGQVAVVGKFDKEKMLKQLEETFSHWNPDAKFVRIENRVLPFKSETIELKARDQASAIYMRGSSLKANFKDDDFEALTIAADILGGGSLDSRLAQGVREEKGLSYQIGCQFQPGEFDSVGQFMIFATMNPENKAALVKTTDEVLARMKQDGVTNEELQASITSYEKKIEAFLADDPSLCNVVQMYGRRGLSLEFLACRLERVRGLTLEKVKSAANKLVSLDAVSVLVGDFPESNETKE